MKKAGTLLDPILRQLGIEAGVRLARMKSEWAALFEKPLSLHMSPGRLSEGELLLFVDSPLWIQQLNYYRQEIIAKLTHYGVTDVRFRLGRVSGPWQTSVLPQQLPLPALSDEEAAFVDRLADAAGDPELGRSVRAAAERSIRSKKRSGR